MAWLSGGRALTAAAAKWKQMPGSKIQRAAVPSAWPHGVKVEGLFTLVEHGSGPAKEHKRMTRARFPNANTETDMWGYASPARVNNSINASAVVEWHKPKKGGPPTFEYLDLSVSVWLASAARRRTRSLLLHCAASRFALGRQPPSPPPTPSD